MFFLIFFSLYGSLHYYFYRSCKRALEISSLWHIIFIGFMLFMVFSPVLIRMTAEQGYRIWHISFSYLAFMWMAVLFLFLSIHLFFDMYALLITLSTKILSPSMNRYSLEKGVGLIVTFVLVAGIIFYGKIEASRIIVEKITLHTDKLPQGINSLRIVQVSDIHFSNINGLRFAKKIYEIVNSLNPDILVSTGDLIEKGLHQKEEVADELRKLQARYGKYAVPGNHEFYYGIQEASEFTESAGFRMLRNETVFAGDLIHITGIDDRGPNWAGEESAGIERKILDQDPYNFTMLLKHQPKVNDKSAELFDLQLSGHTHKGQVFPFSLVTSFFYSFHSGLYKVRENSYIYVSRGTGVWGPPIRFLSRPEITVFDLERR